MTRTLKALGLAGLAVLALGAFASAAGAQNGAFTVGANTGHETSDITGDQIGTAEENYFEVPGFGQMTCENEEVSYTGEIEGGTAKEITVSPTYHGCTAFGGFTTHVHMTGCDYIVTQPEKIEEHVYTGAMDLKCPSGKHIDIEVTTFLGNCDFTIFATGGTEELGGHVVYTVETGEPHDVMIHVAVEGISWTLDPTEGICNTHEGDNDALLVSTITATGFEDDQPHTSPNANDLWISDEE